MKEMFLERNDAKVYPTPKEQERSKTTESINIKDFPFDFLSDFEGARDRPLDHSATECNPPHLLVHQYT